MEKPAFVLSVSGAGCDGLFRFDAHFKGSMFTSKKGYSTYIAARKAGLDWVAKVTLSIDE